MCQDIFQCANQHVPYSVAALEPAPRKEDFKISKRVLIAGSTIVSFLPFLLSSLGLINLFLGCITGLKCAYQDPKGHNI